jgi:hypothetical protein
MAPTPGRPPRVSPGHRRHCAASGPIHLLKAHDEDFYQFDQFVPQISPCASISLPRCLARHPVSSCPCPLELGSTPLSSRPWLLPLEWVEHASIDGQPFRQSTFNVCDRVPNFLRRHLVEERHARAFNYRHGEHSQTPRGGGEKTDDKKKTVSLRGWARHGGRPR